MAVPVRVTGAWTQLLSDWLDVHQLAAPDLRLRLDSRRPDEPVPMQLWQQMLADAVQLVPHDAAPALQIGACAQPRHAGLLGYLSLASATLAEALQAYQRYEHLLYGEHLVDVSLEDGILAMRWPASASTGALADSVAIAALWRMLRRLLPQARLHQVCFAFAADARQQQAAVAHFGCPVRYADNCTAVMLPATLLALPLAHTDLAMRALLEQQARALALALPVAGALDRALQQALVRRLPEGEVSLARVAADMHLSVRSLQRRLQQRGLSWRLLLERTRQQLAQAYLADSALQLGEIALLLGYSEQSAFNRAWRQWTGTTPLQWRRRHAGMAALGIE